MKLRSRWWIDRSLCLHENGELQAGEGEQCLDLGESILMPGLLNAHCHLDYTGMKGLIASPQRFDEWIGEVNRQKRSWSYQDFVLSIKRGMKESLEFGTTALVNWTCDPAWVQLQESLPIRVWWLWEQIGIRKSESLECWDQWSEQIHAQSSLWKAGLAPHAPYTCYEEDFRRAIEWSDHQKMPWSVHVAETEEEVEMFQKSGGALYRFLKSHGREMNDCGRGSPCEMIWNAMKSQKREKGVLLVHANHLDEKDVAEVVRFLNAGGKLAVVHCPRSHRYFGRDPLDPGVFFKNRIPFCLGTDSLASNEDLSMFGEMKCFRQNHPKFSPPEVFKMVTVNALNVLGEESRWDQWQDWIAIPSPGGKKDVWEMITGFTGKPSFVMVNGHIVKNEMV